MRVCTEKSVNSHESYHRISVYWLTEGNVQEGVDFILKVLWSIKKDTAAGETFEVVWYYSNDYLFDLGYDLSNILGMNFLFKNGEGH